VGISPNSCMFCSEDSLPVELSSITIVEKLWFGSSDPSSDNEPPSNMLSSAGVEIWALRCEYWRVAD
jgi:hypothetical protein